MCLIQAQKKYFFLIIYCKYVLYNYITSIQILPNKLNLDDDKSTQLSIVFFSLVSLSLTPSAGIFKQSMGAKNRVRSRVVVPAR